MTIVRYQEQHTFWQADKSEAFSVWPLNGHTLSRFDPVPAARICCGLLVYQIISAGAAFLSITGVSDLDKSPHFKLIIEHFIYYADIDNLGFH